MSRYSNEIKFDIHINVSEFNTFENIVVGFLYCKKLKSFKYVGKNKESNDVSDITNVNMLLGCCNLRHASIIDCDILRDMMALSTCTKLKNKNF